MIIICSLAFQCLIIMKIPRCLSTHIYYIFLLKLSFMLSLTLPTVPVHVYVDVHVKKLFTLTLTFTFINSSRFLLPPHLPPLRYR